MLRKGICRMMILLFPASLMGADLGAAMLYSQSTAWVNGSAAPKSLAIFPGDQVQTPTDSPANIHAWGSNVTVSPDSLVKFEGSSVGVEHGRVDITTSKAMAAHVEVFTITPKTDSWTEFEVADLNGSVQVIARKGDVSVSDGQDTTTVAQGQQTTVGQPAGKTKSKSKKQEGAVTAAHGGIMSSTPVKVGALAAIGVGVGWILAQGDDPLSPTKP